MYSSTSSSDWRRFFRFAAGTAAAVVAVIYAFAVLVDPFDTLPLSPPADRVPVAGNARFAFPALARSDRFDSAIFGTSTSRLLRPAVLNGEFSARFANLAMNAATPYEQVRLMEVFRRAHPAARVVMVGIDIGYCVPGETEQKFTPRPFPAWMYDGSLWRGYGEMFNLYAVETAGQQFGILFGFKRQVYGSDGYTSFVPPDSEYDPEEVASRLHNASRFEFSGMEGAAADWHFLGLRRLEAGLSALSAETRKILFFVPYLHSLMPPPDSPSGRVWHECKLRVAAMAERLPHALVVDFMRPSPITLGTDNYWDGMHYRMGVADRLAHDLAAAAHGEPSPDYVLLRSAGLAARSP